MGVEYWIIAAWALTNLTILVLAQRLGKDIQALYFEVKSMRELMRPVSAARVAEAETKARGQLSAASGL